MQAAPTLNDRLIETNFRPAGFDYLRLILATGVIFFHSMDLTAGYNVAHHDFGGILVPLDDAILPLFFALSGFLVAGSLERSATIISFLGLRVIRLMPALLLETCLSALAIGLYFTTLSASTYLAQPEFFAYFLNIFGDIHYILPGVFTHNPNQYVNGQLWTIPWELQCYLAIAIISILRLTRSKTLFITLLATATAAIWAAHVFLGPDRLDHKMSGLSIPGIVLVESFLYGIALYLFREQIPWNRRLFQLCLILMLGLSTAAIGFWGIYAMAPAAAYVAAYTGLLSPRRTAIVATGDYSYGVYLYGFPVEQALIALKRQPWPITFIETLAITFALAILSWHLIEKHAARLRPALFKAESVVLKKVSKTELLF
jgi:peptidoglycan/LPS O-acetylase OafA/YrhL